MRRAPRWWSIRSIFRRDLQADAISELEHHVGLRAAALERQGMPPAAARAEALRRLGDLDRLAGEVVAIDQRFQRQRQWRQWVQDARHDVIVTFRGLARAPGFALGAIATVGIAIGANLAVFAVVNDVLLRPLPVQDPGRLEMIWEANEEKGWYQETVAASNYLDWRERVAGFSDIAAYASFGDEVTVSTDGPAEVLASRAVTGNFFSVLGIEPVMGRDLRWGETWDTTAPVAMLSHSTWAQRWGEDPSIVGRTIRLDGVEHQVVGVLPESFSLPGAEADIWLPFGWSPSAVTDPSFRRAHWLRAIGRLAPGVRREVVSGQLRSVMSELEAEYPETNRLMEAGLTPLHDFLVGDRRRVILALFAAVALLLVLACANVGNLILVRSLARSHEVAVRTALGAGRSRLIRQGLIESAVIAVAAAAVGTAFGWLLLRLLGSLPRVDGFRFDGLAVDVRMIGYLAVVIAVCVVAFTTIPMLLVGGRDPAAGLRESGRGASSGTAGRRTAFGLAASEVSVAVVLVIAALLLGRSFQELQRVYPGFESSGVVTAALTLPGSTYPDDRSLATAYPRLLEAVEATPGVTRAALVRRLPLTGPSWSSDFTIEGRPAGEYGVEVLHREITPGYFPALDVPLLAGRRFDAGDEMERALPVIIVNRALADAHFPSGDAIGQRIAFTRTPNETTRWWTVVGVVGDELQTNLSEPARMEIFAPLAQDPASGVTLVARTGGDPLSFGEPIRAALHRLDPGLGIYDVRAMTDVAAAATSRERLLAWLLTGFAGVALVLALVGVYGVVAQGVRQRRREIGIRMAMGAARTQILTLVSRQTLAILAAGIIPGIVLAIGASRLLRTLLYGVSPLEPVILIGAPLAMALAGLAAAAIPAVRASANEISGILTREG